MKHRQWGSRPVVPSAPPKEPHLPPRSAEVADELSLGLLLAVRDNADGRGVDDRRAPELSRDVDGESQRRRGTGAEAQGARPDCCAGGGERTRDGGGRGAGVPAGGGRDDHRRRRGQCQRDHRRSGLLACFPADGRGDPQPDTAGGSAEDAGRGADGTPRGRPGGFRVTRRCFDCRRATALRALRGRVGHHSSRWIPPEVPRLEEVRPGDGPGVRPRDGHGDCSGADRGQASGGRGQERAGQGNLGGWRLGR